MKCDPMAYAKCPTRQYCGSSAADCCFTEGSECDQFNQQVLSRPKELTKAFEMVEKEYERAKGLEYVRNPLAYALYQVWKIADRQQAEKIY